MVERERYHFAGNSQRRARPICESSAINRLSLYSLGTNSVWHAHSHSKNIVPVTSWNATQSDLAVCLVE